MNDTIKLIIEMPTEMFQEMRDNDLINVKTLNKSIKAIENGIPLDDVKAEIITERHNLADDKDWGRYYGLGIALEILDNIGKADMRGGKE